jgi:prolyl-tRNA synthetase
MKRVKYASKMYLPLLLEVPAAQRTPSPSHRALLQGGLLAGVGPGLFTWLPQGQQLLERGKEKAKRAKKW